LGILATSATLIGGTVVSLWQAVKAHRAEQVALQQKADSDEIAAITLAAARYADERLGAKQLESEQMRNDLLQRVKDFHGSPERKAELLMDLSDMLRKPADIEVYRQVLAELESGLTANDPLLWNLRYRVALKTMHASEAMGAESSAARDELRRILVWQMAHLDSEDTLIYNTKYALAEELLDEVNTSDALHEAEVLLRSCEAHYERQKNVSDLTICRIELMTTMFDQGRHEEALKLGRETCELAQQELGERHVNTGRAYGRFAKHCREAGFIDEAIRHSRHALDIYWHTVGPGYVKANATLDALANILSKKGDLEAVLQLRRDSLSVYDQQLGTMSPDTLWEAGKVVDALRDLHRIDDAHALADLWLERVRVDGHLPPGAASLLVYEFLNLKDLGQHVQAEKLLPQLPGLLQAQDWSDSAYYLLRRWKAVATRLKKAEQPAECDHIIKHILQVMKEGRITGRKANGMRSEFEKLLGETEGVQKAP
jgi:hypothetical protein